ncbi:MAG TPA: AI-2E family transporter [Bryobacteraceae bacterium]|nr:AI-2E family transporter [Bryobacteraceae bacterium]
MLGIDRRAARYAWTAAAVVLLLLLVYLIRKTLFIFILALLFAYLLSPLVDFLDRVLPGRRTRTPALVAAYLILVGALVLIGFEIGSRVLEEANALGSVTQTAAPDAPPPKTFMTTVLNSIQAQIRQHTNEILGYVPKASLKVLSIAGNLIYVVVVPILSFFFIKDARVIRQQILDLFDEGPRRDLLEDLAKDTNRLLIQYMRALLILSLNTFTWFSIYLSFTGVPFSLLLAALAGLLEFVPVVGPLSAAVVVLLVAGYMGYPHLLWIVIFLVVYRIFQDYVLSPRLMSAGMELHPLMVIFGVFAGGEIAGVAGMILSVPVIALIRVLYVRLQKVRRSSEASQLTP